MTIAIIIPLYNQVHFTKLCLESLARYTQGQIKIIVIDNASSDGTAEYLASRNDITVISNNENRGCAGAWNQGVKAASEAEWIVVLNNDVIVSPLWLDGLLKAATLWDLDIICPAIREGDYNYDIEPYASEYVSCMHNTIRRGIAHGICFMVHHKVFKDIGYFDENFRIGQYEDSDFFLRAKLANYNIATVGNSFMHHFGSITQKSLSTVYKAKPYALENKAYFNKKWRLSWWQRALRRNKIKMINWLHSSGEKLLHRHTLVEKWIDGRLRYF